MIKLKSKEHFSELKMKQTIFLFTAKWCSDCRYIEPFLPEIESMFTDYTFVTVDRDEFIDLCIENDVYGIPSFLIYKNNQLAGSFVSKLRKSKTDIIEFIKGV